MKTIRIVALAGLLSSASFHAALAADPIPDLMTKYFAWTANGYDYEPPLDGKPAPVTHDPNHPYCVNGQGCNVQPRIGDENSPILLPWAQSVVDQWNNDILKGGKQAFVPQSRCWPSGVPLSMLLAGGRYHFQVSKDQYMIIYERGPTIRNIWLNQPHTDHPPAAWGGESIGHYEGPSLVVDTIDTKVHPYSEVDHYRTPHSEQLHTVERYTIAPDGAKMVGTLVVEDPGTFTTPWSASKTYRPNKVPISDMEYICAEGENNETNYLNEDEVPIPQTLVPDF